MEEVDVVEGQEQAEIEQQEPGAEETQVAAETPEEKPEPTAKEAALQAELDRVRRKNRELVQAQPQRQAVVEPPVTVQADFIPPGYPAEPVLDAFNDYDQYNRALVRWEAGRIIATEKHVEASGKEQQARKTVMDSHGARLDAAKDKYTDMEDVFESAPNISFNTDTFMAIVDSDQSADIAYHLAKNPAEAQRIVALPPVQQIKEIARLEDKFKVAPPAKRVSQAPTPINAIGGSGDPSTKDPDKMSDEEWLAHEHNRLAKLGRRY